MPELPPTAPERDARGSIAPAYFERLYASDPDPWRFATSPYEAAKYAATLAALPLAHYGRAFEIGCAGGVLTRALAERCDSLQAVDVAPDALAQARRRTADASGVRIERMVVPGEWPEGTFDLVVLSEVGYYLGTADFEQLRQRCARAVRPGGHLLLVHWTGETDYPLTGDAVHDAFVGADAWVRLSGHRTADYRLDVLERKRPTP
ncbi:class I SAM-dependent methyltransferase [Rubricoccus marinus]|uniref:Methyltransferase domain-containing protein n=1 Tax=Rubricoccus marinus TaxID=716817 RepID=A0A259TXT6_9BACT|nr:class I SAM-dependent methyltransferase [Rubricoccus marinus]OZC02506.1 hypothetical protein BSZ36_05655 [Rubricoccus marinus]